MSGGRHIQFLVENKLFIFKPSSILESIYSANRQSLPRVTNPTTTPNREGAEPQDGEGDRERLLLSQDGCKAITQALDLPQLGVELERAIWQVEGAIKKQGEEATADEQTSTGGDTNSASKQAPGHDDKKAK